MFTLESPKNAYANIPDISFKFFFFAVFFSVSTLTVDLDAVAGVVDHVEASVNQEVILSSDLDRFKRTYQLQKEIDPLFHFWEGIEKADRENVLDFLIFEKLLGQQFKITDSEVTAEINNIMKSNGLSDNQLNEFLSAKGFTLSDYQTIMRIGLQKRALLDREIRVRVNISDDDVRNYFYNQALKDSKIPLEYSIQMIVLNTKSFKSSKVAMDQAQKAFQALQQGENFSDVNNRYSDNPSEQSGTDSSIGFVAEDQLSPQFLSAIKHLKIGGVSSPITLGEKIYLLRLHDVRSVESKQYETQKEAIRSQLAKQEYKRQLSMWSEKALTSAYIKKNKLTN